MNPSANKPPFTDHGNPGAIWYSFDLTPKRLEGGGWTHQVTERELPLSKDLAGVNMQLTAGSFRELHWHLADEWAIMPAMAGHYIENTGTEDIVFLEMFKTSHYAAVSLNQWIARMPDKMAQAHLKLPISTIRRAPQEKINVLPK